MTPTGSWNDSLLCGSSRRTQDSRCRLRLSSSFACVLSLAVYMTDPSKPEAGPADSLWSSVGLQFAVDVAIAKVRRSVLLPSAAC